MANGSMTTSLTEEKTVREALVDEGYVDCIVQLPDKLFLGTGIPACLWFLSKNRQGTNGYRARTDEILFIDAREKGEMVSRRQRVLTDEEIHEGEDARTGGAVARPVRGGRTAPGEDHDEPGGPAAVNEASAHEIENDDECARSH